jgi:hypothetical protein
MLIDEALTNEALCGSTVEEGDIVGLFLCGVQCDRDSHCVEVWEEHIAFDRPSKGQLAQAREKSWQDVGFIKSAATLSRLSGVAFFR